MRHPRPKRIALVLAVALAAALVGSGFDRTAAPADCGEGFVAVERATTAPLPLRVATFNLHSGRDRDGEPALDLAARTLAGCDVVGLQEVRGVFPGLGESQAGELADALALAWLFAPSEQRFWHGHFGNALLTDRAPLAWRSEPLVNTRGKAYRNQVLVELDLGSTGLRVLVTHLDTRADRRPQLAAVAERFLALEPPAVLLGDLNTRADDAALAGLLAAPDVRDAHASVELPANRVDWILVRGLDVSAAGVTDLGASDHPCLWADVALPRGAPR